MTEFGCNSLQGFLLGRPMAPEQFQALTAMQADPA